MTLYDDMEACRIKRESWEQEENKREPDTQDPTQRAFVAGFFEGSDYGFAKAVRLSLSKLSVAEAREIFGLQLPEIIKMKASL